jgi:hypothetical protein
MQHDDAREEGREKKEERRENREQRREQGGATYLNKDADLRARVQVREDGAFKGLLDEEANFLAASIPARKKCAFDNRPREQEGKEQ